MTWQLTPFVIPGLLAAVLSGWLTIYAARRRDSGPGVTAFALFGLGVCVWAACRSIELLGADLPTKLPWNRLAFSGLAVAAAAWFAFTWQYSHHQRRLSRRAVALLAIHPVLLTLVVWTNDLHHLFYRTIDAVDNGLYVQTKVQYGPLFVVHAVYAYALVLLGTAFVARLLLHYRAEHLYGRQALALSIGTLLPWVGNVMNVTGLNPIPAVDLGFVGFALGGLAMAWGIFQHGLLEVTPIAHDAIVRSMVDGIVVLDAAGRVVELNPAAERVLGRTAADLLGKSAEAAVFADHPELMRHYQDASESRVEVALGAERHFDVKVSPIADRHGHLIGRVLTLHEVTERRRERAQLETRIKEYEEQLGAQTIVPSAPPAG